MSAANGENQQDISIREAMRNAAEQLRDQPIYPAHSMAAGPRLSVDHFSMPDTHDDHPPPGNRPTVHTPNTPALVSSPQVTDSRDHPTDPTDDHSHDVPPNYMQ